jgi:hypothetical protein
LRHCSPVGFDRQQSHDTFFCKKRPPLVKVLRVSPSLPLNCYPSDRTEPKLESTRGNQRCAIVSSSSGCPSALIRASALRPPPSASPEVKLVIHIVREEAAGATTSGAHPCVALAMPLACTELLGPPRHACKAPATSCSASPARCRCSSTSRSWQATRWAASSRSCRSCPHLGTPRDIDVATVSHFTFLYSRESMAKHAQVAARREADASCIPY